MRPRCVCAGPIIPTVHTAGLSDDLAAVETAINGMANPRTTCNEVGGCTCISCGLERAWSELTRTARSEVPRILVLFSDAEQNTNGGPGAAVRTAASIKANGAVLFAVGYTTDVSSVNEVELRLIASEPDSTFARTFASVADMLASLPTLVDTTCAEVFYACTLNSPGNCGVSSIEVVVHGRGFQSPPEVKCRVGGEYSAAVDATLVDTETLRCATATVTSLVANPADGQIIPVEVSAQPHEHQRQVAPNSASWTTIEPSCEQHFMRCHRRTFCRSLSTVQPIQCCGLGSPATRR